MSFLQYFDAFWDIMLELSPALLLGLAIAGLIHVFLPKNLIRRRLSGNGFSSVFYASLIGVPMPLCSCGVVPTAIGLKNDGASKGAATGFLISTPQTGVDSILVSAAFLGWPFAIFKVVAAFISGLMGGVLVNRTDPGVPEAAIVEADVGEGENSQGSRLAEMLRFSIFELLEGIAVYLVIGIALSALIGVLLPSDILADTVWVQGFAGMLLALAISMPLYVCTTASVPIAASLIAAGMPLGTALVFLMAGPATNIATVGAIFRGLGGRVLAIYLGVVASMSMIFGLLFDSLLAPAASVPVMHQHGETSWLATSSAILLSSLLIWLLSRRLVRAFSLSKNGDAAKEEENEMQLKLTVGGMTCGHCAANVTKALRKGEGVIQVTTDLQSGKVLVEGDDLDRRSLAELVVSAGYKVESEG